MQGRAKRMGTMAMVVVAALGVARPTRAAAMTGSYTLIDAGPDNATTGSYPGINESGDVGNYGFATHGAYTEGTIHVPNTDSGQNSIPTEVFLRKTGSEVNLLPHPLRDAGTGIAGFNSLGHVVGNSYNAPRVGPFYYDTSTNNLIHLKSALGLDGPAQVLGINDKDRIVGDQGFGRAILYASPTAVPVELSTLITDTKGWLLESASSINSRGEIAEIGAHDNIGGYFKLEPQAVPEPSSVFLIAILGVLVAQQSRRLRQRACSAI